MLADEVGGRLGVGREELAHKILALQSSNFMETSSVISPIAHRYRGVWGSSSHPPSGYAEAA